MITAGRPEGTLYRCELPRSISSPTGTGRGPLEVRMQATRNQNNIEACVVHIIVVEPRGGVLPPSVDHSEQDPLRGVG